MTIFSIRYNDTIIGEDKEPWEIVTSQSILFNLIEILASFDLGDEIGRQRLRALAIHLLTINSCNENIIKSLVKICEKLVPNSDERLQVYVDVIRSLVDQDSLEKALNVMDPNVVEAMEKDSNLNVQVSSLKLKLFELKEEESKFVKVKDYARVSRIAEEIASCQDRLVALVRPLMAGGSVRNQRGSNFIVEFYSKISFLLFPIEFAATKTHHERATNQGIKIGISWCLFEICCEIESSYVPTIHGEFIKQNVFFFFQ